MKIGLTKKLYIPRIGQKYVMGSSSKKSVDFMISQTYVMESEIVGKSIISKL